MNIVDGAKDKVERLVGKAKDQHAAHKEKAESDITADAGVAGSRANAEGNDGSYVGRTTPQLDAEVQESGAEARSEATRLSHDER